VYKIAIAERYPVGRELKESAGGFAAGGVQFSSC